MYAKENGLPDNVFPKYTVYVVQCQNIKILNKPKSVC